MVDVSKYQFLSSDADSFSRSKWRAPAGRGTALATSAMLESAVKGEYWQKCELARSNSADALPVF